MKICTYIGCYTDDRQEGIYILESDTESGAFQRVGVVKGIENAIYLTLDRACTRLYAGLGLPERGARATNGAVAAYSIENRDLKLLNAKPIGVTPPCHVALAPDEKSLVFAEYTNALSGVFGLRDDLALADAPPLTVQHSGSGPDASRQEKAHAHCAVVTPDGRHLCIVDLGIDRVKVYDFAGRRDSLAEKPKLEIACAGGAGPRHIIFHPNGKTAWLLHELNNTLSSFRYNGEAFILVQTLPTLPADFTGKSLASALKFSPDGRRLLTSNRGCDSIAIFDIDPDSGTMALVNIAQLAGKFPRDFEFMPGGKFLLIGHENSNELMSYAYDAQRATLTPAHPGKAMHRPVCVVFGAELG